MGHCTPTPMLVQICFSLICLSNTDENLPQACPKVQKQLIFLCQMCLPAFKKGGLKYPYPRCGCMWSSSAGTQMQLMTESPPAMASTYSYPRGVCRYVIKSHLSMRVVHIQGDSWALFSPPLIGQANLIWEEDSAKIFGVPASYPCTSVKGMHFQCMHCSIPKIVHH